MSASEVLVDAHSLAKRFDDFVAVDGIDFQVHQGEVFGFLGPNGAGKSSTMRMIACVSPISGGSLRVLGADPVTDGPAIRARLGVVPQEDTLDTELSVEDNLIIYGRYFGIPKSVLRGRAAQLLDFVQLGDRATSKVDPLSGGMKRRLTIARALINEPDLLLLDEPTTGLDPQARHLVWERLYQLKLDGVTQVLTTHYMDEAERLCDRLVIMDGGRIVDEGSPAELIARHVTREVVELRLDHGEQRRACARHHPQLGHPDGEPGRPRPDLHRGRGPVGGRPARRRPPAPLGAGATQHPRGRLLDADRAHPGRGLTTVTSPVLHYVEREALILRRLWHGIVFSQFISPALYLVAMGIGLGSLVDAAGTRIDGLTYLEFVAPGLMAATVLQSSTGEALWPVLAGFKWMGFYHGMAASPMRPRDVYTGTVTWIGIRLTLTATIFLFVAAVLGALLSPLAVLAIPAAVLCALALAAPLAAFSATQETDHRFPLVLRFITLPMFLFSATFFPLSQLPVLLRPLAWVSPLWHGVELCRDATTGTLAPGGWPLVLAHVAVLCAYLALGFAWGLRTFTRRLAT